MGSVSPFFWAARKAANDLNEILDPLFSSTRTEFVRAGKSSFNTVGPYCYSGRGLPREDYSSIQNSAERLLFAAHTFQFSRHQARRPSSNITSNPSITHAVEDRQYAGKKPKKGGLGQISKLFSPRNGDRGNIVKGKICIRFDAVGARAEKGYEK